LVPEGQPFVLCTEGQTLRVEPESVAHHANSTSDLLYTPLEVMVENREDRILTAFVEELIELLFEFLENNVDET
jgi:hypothetical protein